MSLLSRFRNQLKSKPNNNTWSQLVLELLIVVVGILIALGIDSYRTELGNAKLEADFLRQLHKDLLRAEKQIATQMETTIHAEAYTLRLLECTREDLRVENDSLALWLIRAFYFSDPRPTLSTAQALAASDKLYLLKDVELRGSITTMIDRIRQLESRLIPFEQRIMDAQSIINSFAAPPSRGLPESIGMFSSELDILRNGVPAEVSIDLKPILKRSEVESALDETFWAHENLRWYQQEMILATLELRKSIEKVIIID